MPEGREQVSGAKAHFVLPSNVRAEARTYLRSKGIIAPTYLRSKGNEARTYLRSKGIEARSYLRSKGIEARTYLRSKGKGCVGAMVETPALG